MAEPSGRRLIGKGATGITGAVCLSVGLAMVTGGCVSAGLAAVGPVFSAIHAVADRSAERTYPADLGTAWGGTIDALSRMGVHIQHTDRAGEAWTVEGKGEAIALTVRLERVTPQLTRASVRAENGGLTADKKTAEEILNQVAISLAPPPVPARGAGDDSGAPSAALSSLRREVERLGAKVEARGRPAAPLGPVAPATLETGRIFVVPGSAALPSAPVPDGGLFPSRAETLQAERIPEMPQGPASASGSDAVVQTVDGNPSSEAAVLLAPVGSLTPIGALTGPGGAK